MREKRYEEALHTYPTENNRSLLVETARGAMTQPLGSQGERSWLIESRDTSARTQGTTPHRPGSGEQLSTANHR